MSKKVKSSLSDETNQLIAAAMSQGWRYEESRRGHVRLYSPDGKTIVGHSGTPSDFRAMRNFRSRLKRAGVSLDGLAAVPVSRMLFWGGLLAAGLALWYTMRGTKIGSGGVPPS